MVAVHLQHSPTSLFAVSNFKVCFHFLRVRLFSSLLFLDSLHFILTFSYYLLSLCTCLCVCRQCLYCTSGPSIMHRKHQLLTNHRPSMSFTPVSPPGQAVHVSSCVSACLAVMYLHYMCCSVFDSVVLISAGLTATVFASK